MRWMSWTIKPPCSFGLPTFPSPFRSVSVSERRGCAYQQKVLGFSAHASTHWLSSSGRSGNRQFILAPQNYQLGQLRRVIIQALRQEGPISIENPKHEYMGAQKEGWIINHLRDDERLYVQIY